jgi:Rrf2 family iron-sulfur cluster assembly transcriptional regulator
VDESVDATRCQGKRDCHGNGQCLTHELWSDLSLRIHDFLSHIKLADLVEKRHEKAQACADEHRARKDTRKVVRQPKRVVSTTA